MIADASHARVPGVKLQLWNDATGGLLSTVANNSGQYTGTAGVLIIPGT
jgi:hypothetical protein